MAITHFKNNRNPSLTDTITVDGVPYDLTSSTVKLKMRLASSSTLKVDTAAVVVSAVAGTIRYDWAALDVDTEGDFIAWWEVTTGGKTQDTPEFVIQVRDHDPFTGYVTATSLKATAELRDTSYADEDIDLAIAAASRAIDEVCAQRFHTTGADETRYFTPVSPDFLHVGAVNAITTLKTDLSGDGTFETTWTVNTDHVLEPLNAVLDGRPYTTIRRRPSASPWFPAGQPRSVEIVGRFGWASPPPQIVEATTIIATQLLLRARQAPFGVVAVGLDGDAVRIGRFDPDVTRLLAPFLTLQVH